jgi:hypothetical protein
MILSVISVYRLARPAPARSRVVDLGISATGDPTLTLDRAEVDAIRKRSGLLCHVLRQGMEARKAEAPSLRGFRAADSPTVGRRPCKNTIIRICISQLDIPGEPR